MSNIISETPSVTRNQKRLKESENKIPDSVQIPAPVLDQRYYTYLYQNPYDAYYSYQGLPVLQPIPINPLPSYIAPAPAQLPVPLATSAPSLPITLPIPTTVPSALAPAPVYDDKDGHYIINIGEDLTLRYKILSLLGEGTFGKVVKVFDRQSNNQVAIKIVKSIQKYRDAAMGEIRIFETLRKHDPSDDRGVIHLIRWFDFRGHICMVFQLFGMSIFDFLKGNMFLPFPIEQIREFARQTVSSVLFLHDLHMIHTDIKPENILLVSSDFQIFPMTSTQQRKRLSSTSIKLIDFGSAIFETDHHSSVVCTRHYRAPEIILGMGWSYPCDMWSIGCVLIELYTGEALFQTHDNLEHLAMMERILGRAPRSLSRCEGAKKFFDIGKLKYPDSTTTEKSEKRVQRLKSIDQMFASHDKQTQLFHDLLKKLLEYEPSKRITAREARQHPFLVNDL